MFNPNIETLPRPQLRELQNRRLRDLVRRLDRQSAFFRDRLEAVGVAPEEISSVEKLHRLPPIRKELLRDLYPFGLLAVDRSQVARVHASSGTTGKPVVAAYTRGDLEVLAEVNARSLAAAGARPGMTFHNAYGYGLFTGGLGLHAGAEKLGLTVVPASGGMTQRQITLIQDFRPDIIGCTPSYAQTLAEQFRLRGIPPDQISLRYAVLGAEPWTEAIRADVDSGLGVRSLNIYGLTEVIGPGVSQECLEGRAGSHIWEDHFHPEILDPDTEQPVADGELGVLVLTTLTKQAMPVVRFWTGDLVSLDSSPCPCGRTHRRMSRVKGRTDDLLIVRGVNLYPTQIESLIGDCTELTPHYQLEIDRPEGLDRMVVRVETRSPGDPSPRPLLADRLKKRIKDTLGLNAEIAVLPPNSIPRSEGGKLQRVIDRRKLY